MFGKLFWGIIVSFSVVVFSGQQVAFAGSGVQHSVHDFTDNNGWVENEDANPIGWNNKRKELCRVCHVPHEQGNVPYGNNGLLWNHQLTTKTNWQMYASDPSTIDFIDGTIEAAPSGTSKMCLGCHDGVSAINQYDNKTPIDPGYGGGYTVTMDDYAPLFIIGATTSSLMNNHPISIVYDEAADPELNDPTVATFATGETVESVLVNGRVECSTCHDVHNKEAVAMRLLRDWQRGANVTGTNSSSLCFVCHNK